MVDQAGGITFTPTTAEHKSNFFAKWSGATKAPETTELEQTPDTQAPTEVATPVGEESSAASPSELPTLDAETEARLAYRSVTPPTVMTRGSTDESLELANRTSPTAATPKPSVKRELLFEGMGTPKKAKAPVPSRKVVYAMVKTEKLNPTAAKSTGNAASPPVQPLAPEMSKPPSPVVSKPPPPVVSKPPPPVVSKPPPPVVSKPPSPVVSKPPPPVVSKPPSPVVSKPPSPVVTKPPSPVVMGKPPSPTLQQQAAMLRTAPPTPKSSPEMAERRFLNKATDMTDEDRKLLELETVILEGLAQKSDDELDAMMQAIMAHPLFPRFVQDQKEEYGVDEWSFEEIEQIATWEIWAQQFALPNAPIAKAAAAAATSPSSHCNASPPAPTPKTVSPPVHVPKVALPKPVAAAKAADPVIPKPPAPAKQNVWGGQPGDSAFGIAIKDGSTATPVVPTGYDNRQAMQAEFKRKMNRPDANDIPKCVVDAWNKACDENSKTAKTHLFNTWLQAGKDFSMLELSYTKTHTDRLIGSKQHGWRTRAQLMLLHGKDSSVVDRIIARKESEGLFQDHPDAEGLKMYWVLTDLSQNEQEEHTESRTLALNTTVAANSEGAQLIGREAHFPSAVMLGAPPKAKALNVLPPPGRDVPGGGRGNGNNNQPTPPHPKANGKDNKTPPIPRTPKPTKPKEMPDAHADPMAAFEWLLPALEKDLKESKMWPIRLAQHKHQEKLRDLLANHSALIEQKYFELQSYKSLKEDEMDLEALTMVLNVVATVRDEYLKDASAAAGLCKSKGGKKRKTEAE